VRDRSYPSGVSDDADRLVGRFADAAGMDTGELLAQILAGRFEEEAEARAAEAIANEAEPDEELEESERWSEALSQETDDSDGDAAWWT
jgi:hypothetical protein